MGQQLTTTTTGLVVVVLLLGLSLSLNLGLASAASRDDLIDSCAKNESTCIGFNEASAGDCSKDVKSCTFAFANIRRNSEETFRVHLVGKGTGWIGIGFSDDNSGIMRPDNLGVVCLNKQSPSVRILKLELRPAASPGQSVPFSFDDSSLADSLTDGKLDVVDDWMICEFQLKSKPKHAGKTLDLLGQGYKIGLAGNPDRAFDDGNTAYPIYHGPSRGSSARKLDIFKNMEIKSDAGRRLATTTTSAMMMSIVPALIAYYLF